MISLSKRVRLSSPVWPYVAAVLDALIISLCAVVSSRWYFDNTLVLARHSLLPLAAIVMMSGFSIGTNRSWRGSTLLDVLKPVATAWTYVAVVIIAWLYLSKAATDISRLWFGIWVLSSFGAMCIARLAIFTTLRWLRSKGYNYKSVLIIGHGQLSELAQKAVVKAPWSGLRVQAIAEPESLAEYLRTSGQQAPDEVWLCLPVGDKAGLQTTLDVLRHSTANIRMLPDWFSLRLMNHGISEMVGLQMLDMSSSPITGMTRLVKAVQDIVLATVILVLISPLMLGIAIAIKLTSPGPVLFRQVRHGWNGEKISVYKFRSMVVHREADLQVKQATRNDARITPLGAFLRRTSLDELPQFFNVLQGRMSIVGPRPHAVQHNEHYKELVPGYMRRHKVKPGITGWAQINGFRGETDTLWKMEQRVVHDLFYIEHISLGLDLKIILITLFKGFVHRNAR